jgi:hypothetical protein
VAARTVQGMARVRSGQARAWPLVSDRRGCRDSAVKGGPHQHLPERGATLLYWQGTDSGEAGPPRALGGVPVVVPDPGCFQEGQALDGLAEGQRYRYRG